MVYLTYFNDWSRRSGRGSYTRILNEATIDCHCGVEGDAEQVQGTSNPMALIKINFDVIKEVLRRSSSD
ncbi:hypothetical protein KIN20_021594 [Parelaphostrongylus tenuis]|uniref:Uncharacterized protein n=1 Tax=Parelaphostrongylus tenuis TaxID=148309 RepID=A0AAD5NB00_PARTN|nr:hypothetical protein KIN20_021594 [Parelaphostrongylus tenuis]